MFSQSDAYIVTYFYRSVLFTVEHLWALLIIRLGCLFIAILLKINCSDYNCVKGVWLFKARLKFLMLAALVITNVLMPAALTLLDYHCLVVFWCKTVLAVTKNVK
jgi:hypothetical protein